MSRAHIIEADLTWTGDAFEAGVQIEVGADARISRLGATGSPPDRRLAGRALLPGFVNVHSHAFQRGLRGRGETFPEGAGSFWTWREAMYALVDSLDPDRLHELSLLAFREMLGAGITSVGEFHYLRHDRTGRGFAMDEAVLRAAADAGIRIALLSAHYSAGGIGMPLAGAQRRFACASPAEYWRQVDRLAGVMDPRTQSLGAVAHSVRAVPIDDIVSLHEESRRRGMVFHMHVEEQRREIEECCAALGEAPMALLNERLKIDERFTAVHCTHTDPLDMERFIASGGNLCICPLTEANLGDGVADLPGILDSGGAVGVGTDSNSRLSMTEELRWLEYVQRLEREERGIVIDDSGRTASTLLGVGTENGARCLGVDAGRISPGALADLIAIDLTDPSLHGWTPETLLDSFLYGASDRAIAGVCVGGRWVIGDPAISHGAARGRE